MGRLAGIEMTTDRWCLVFGDGRGRTLRLTTAAGGNSAGYLLPLAEDLCAAWREGERLGADEVEPADVRIDEADLPGAQNQDPRGQSVGRLIDGEARESAANLGQRIDNLGRELKALADSLRVDDRRIAALGHELYEHGNQAQALEQWRVIAAEQWALFEERIAALERAVLPGTKEEEEALDADLKKVFEEREAVAIHRRLLRIILKDAFRSL